MGNGRWCYRLRKYQKRTRDLKGVLMMAMGVWVSGVKRVGDGEKEKHSHGGEEELYKKTYLG